MQPKAYLIKVDHESYWFNVVELPRQMSKRDREVFERRRKECFSDYVFAIGYDDKAIIAKMLGVRRSDVRETGSASVRF